MIIENV